MLLIKEQQPGYDLDAGWRCPMSKKLLTITLVLSFRAALDGQTLDQTDPGIFQLEDRGSE